jgi:uncharacterized OsmC-like protein
VLLDSHRPDHPEERILMPTLTASVRLLDGHVALGQQEEGHTLLLDRPRSTGGSELGFNGGHLLLLGWGACFKSNLVAAASARDIEIRGLQLRIEGDTADHPSRFARLRLLVTLDASVDDEGRSKLVAVAGNSCIVSNTLRRSADVEIQLEAQ